MATPSPPHLSSFKFVFPTKVQPFFVFLSSWLMCSGPQDKNSFHDRKMDLMINEMILMLLKSVIYKGFIKCFRFCQKGLFILKKDDVNLDEMQNAVTVIQL